MSIDQFQILAKLGKSTWPEGEHYSDWRQVDWFDLRGAARIDKTAATRERLASHPQEQSVRG